MTTTTREEEYDAGWIDDHAIRFTLLDENASADTITSIHRVIELPR